MQYPVTAGRWVRWKNSREKAATRVRVMAATPVSARVPQSMAASSSPPSKLTRIVYGAMSAVTSRVHGRYPVTR